MLFNKKKGFVNTIFKLPYIKDTLPEFLTFIVNQSDNLKTDEFIKKAIVYISFLDSKNE